MPEVHLRRQYGLIGLDLTSLVSKARDKAEDVYDQAKGYLSEVSDKTEAEIREQIKDIAREAGEEAGASAGTSFQSSFIPWIVGGAGVLLLGLAALSGKNKR